MPDDNHPFDFFVPLRELPKRAKTPFSVQPDSDVCAAIAAELDLLSLDRFSVEATLKQVGRDSWRLDGTVHARISQPCVITLVPVVQTLSEPFTRIFEPQDSDAPHAGIEVDIDLESDDPPEALGRGINIAAVALEHLALGIDPYPRANDADFETLSAAPPGTDPLPAGGEKPFAALEALKKQMEKGK